MKRKVYERPSRKRKQLELQYEKRRIKNLKKSEIKKIRKQFKVGDWITWGIEEEAAQIVKIPEHENGVYVYTHIGETIIPEYFVAFDGNLKCSEGGHGPIIHAPPHVKRWPKD